MLSYAANNCTGATYYDATNDACVACPAGYDYNTDDGKTSINQCQTHCNGGTYVEQVLPRGYTKLEYIAGTGTQFINTNLTVIDKPNIKFYVKWMRTATPINNYEAVFRAYQSEAHNTYRIISSQKSPTTSLVTPNTIAAGGNIGVNLATNVIHYGIVSNLYAIIDGVEYTAWQRGTQIPSTTKLQILGSPGFVGRIYTLKVYSNTTLVADFIPARRNSDNVAGMYDAVNNIFYTNSGTGAFVTGPVNACYDTGFGYWAPESTVNYGATGVHNACPVGTYSDVLNATSSQACKTCTGTTYNSTPGARVCTECPLGYKYNTTAGKTTVSDCQINCPAGQYVSTYTTLDYLQSNGHQEIVTNLDGFDAQDIVIIPKWMLTGPSYNNYYGYVVGVYQSEQHNTYRILTNRGNTTQYVINGNSVAENSDYVDSITANTIHSGYIANNTVGIDGKYTATTRKGQTLPSDSKLFLFRYFVGRIYSVYVTKAGITVMNLIPVRRNSDGVLGMYDTITGAFYTNSGSGNFTAGPAVSNDYSSLCTNVGPGFWSPGSIANYGHTSIRNACPVGTTTIGFGSGADEANDCGRALHIGEHVIYTRANKQTTPSLHIQTPNGNIYYGNMSLTNHNLSGLHLSYDGNQYTVYDESLLNEEREF